MNKFLDAIRFLGIDAINKANSGHPGIVLGSAPITFLLFTKLMKHNPKEPLWFNRDRFVLSAGHGSALLYSTLHLSGYDYSLEDLKTFRQWNSKTPGHPEMNQKDGIEVTTGPLGQGIAMAVGMAIGEKFLGAKYNKPEFNIIDHHTFVLCGDGDLQEGISYEAISLAGRLNLNKLILIHDSNDVQLDDFVAKAMNENMHLRFQAANWNTIKVNDGENLKQLEKAISQAKKSSRPTYIEVKTTIGLGATKQGTSAVHGAPLGVDVETVRNYFNWEFKEFEIPNEVYDYYQETSIIRGNNDFQEWQKLMNEYTNKFQVEATQLQQALNREWIFDEKKIDQLNPLKAQATRVSSGMIFEAIAQDNITMIGGSADLSSSTKIKGLDGDFSEHHPSGRNLNYGVREFAMTAINNGLFAHGAILPFASGFFVFADYMKPAMRLASLTKSQVLFILTHDSIAVGEDGPTHQPIEQLAMIRTIPNHNLIRPADFNETKAAYAIALESKTTPTTIALTRQDLPCLNNEKNIIAQVKRGAYLLADEENAQVTLVATGSEVGLALKVKAQLAENDIISKVVSMPSMNLFFKQSQKYKDQIIDQKTFLVSIEMGTTFGWERIIGNDGLAIGIDCFGHSAPGEQVVKEYGFEPSIITQRIMKKMKENK